MGEYFHYVSGSAPVKMSRVTSWGENASLWWIQSCVQTAGAGITLTFPSHPSTPASSQSLLCVRLWCGLAPRHAPPRHPLWPRATAVLEAQPCSAIVRGDLKHATRQIPR